MIFLGSRRAWELLAPNPFAEQDSILRWQRMAGALHENRSEVQLKLPRRAFKRTRKVIVGFAHPGMLVFRRVAAHRPPRAGAAKDAGRRRRPPPPGAPPPAPHPNKKKKEFFFVFGCLVGG